MGKGALGARRSADARSGMPAAQSHQVHVVTQYGPSGGSFAYQGNSFRDAGASETPTVTLGCALFLCGEMKGVGVGGRGRRERSVFVCACVFGKGGK